MTDMIEIPVAYIGFPTTPISKKMSFHCDDDQHPKNGSILSASLAISILCHCCIHLETTFAELFVVKNISFTVGISTLSVTEI